jgi:drug/metabolite transporter (DMT)-like permease
MPHRDPGAARRPQSVHNPSGARTRGVGYGVATGLLWGLAFVVPELLAGWSSVTISTGRYLAYGLCAVVAAAVLARRDHALRVAIVHWRHAARYAVTGNIGYYLLLVIAIQAMGAAAPTTIIGSIPVVMAVVANVRRATFAWPRLALPTGLVLGGLGAVNGSQLVSAGSPGAAGTVLGVLTSVAAVAVWVSYGIGNADFLDRHRDIRGSTWSTAVGLHTGLLALLLVPVALWIETTGNRTPAGAPARPGITALVIGSLVLGLAVSWAGTWLWNEASARLPTAVAGMLVLVETVAGYGYAYLLDGRPPPPLELLGFALIIAGVVITARLRQLPGE